MYKFSLLVTKDEIIWTYKTNHQWYDFRVQNEFYLNQVKAFSIFVSHASFLLLNVLK